MSADLKEALELFLPFSERLERVILALHLSLPASCAGGMAFGFSQDHPLGQIWLELRDESNLESPDWLTWNLVLRLVRDRGIVDGIHIRGTHWQGEFFLRYVCENGKLKQVEWLCNCFDGDVGRCRLELNPPEPCEGTPIPEEWKNER